MTRCKQCGADTELGEYSEGTVTCPQCIPAKVTSNVREPQGLHEAYIMAQARVKELESALNASYERINNDTKNWDRLVQDQCAEIAKLRRVVDAAREAFNGFDHPAMSGLRKALRELDGHNHPQTYSTQCKVCDSEDKA